MNSCILILGMWFLKLDTGNNTTNFVNVSTISYLYGDDNYPRIHTTSAPSTLTGWISEQDRYMSTEETIELISSCKDNIQ